MNLIELIEAVILEKAGDYSRGHATTHEMATAIAIAYIAGPMTGIPEFNRPAFVAAAAHFRAMGWEVVSPVEIEEQHGDGVSATAHRAHCLRDIAALAMCDAICLLSGWQDSKGASAEHWCAVWMRVSLVSLDMTREDCEAVVQFKRTGKR